MKRGDLVVYNPLHAGLGIMKPEKLTLGIILEKHPSTGRSNFLTVRWSPAKTTELWSSDVELVSES